MKRSSILSISAALLVSCPTLSPAQQPVPAEQTPIDQLNALKARVTANFHARVEAARKCDVEQYRGLVNELYSILQESNRLLEANRNADAWTYPVLNNENKQIRFTFNNSQAELQRLEAACSKNTSAPEGKIGTIGSTTPETAPEQFRMPADWEDPSASLEYLHRWAHVAFNLHTLAAARCDLVEMRAQRSKLETFSRAAEEFRRKMNKGSSLRRYGQKAVGQANTFANTIRDLWKAALARQPMNCPTVPDKAIQAPAPPTTPVPPIKKAQDCPVPGTPGDKTSSEHGMRFMPPDEKSERLLAAHNRARAEVGVQPLTWDRELAAGAAQYAQQMSAVGRVHAPRAGRECVRENLLQSLPGQRSPEQMVGVWIAEKAHFKPGIFPDVSTAGDWSKVGHYTQIIWPTTTHVGCAVHSDARYDWTVCRYTPPGNQDGKRVLEFPPVAKQPAPGQGVPLPYPSAMPPAPSPEGAPPPT